AVERRADEVGVYPVQRGALSGQLDCAGRDVEPGDAGAELRQDDRVFALAAADVENGLSAEIAQQGKTVLFCIQCAGLCVPRDDRRVNRLERLCALFRPAVEEFGFLYQLRGIGHSRRTSKRRAEVRRWAGDESGGN